ncbi:molybdate transport system substrate-binding protein [Variovorax boronicumulans]|uniref:substrate-binding domain-containing protein n=1 Tax=Variovorax boronicumulans TaxID=436515 RepID=UPI00277E730E|nr:substrate-binding domain-containing protein [Variovorax boronicumulans]MDQ0070791.1 molybdate transport system substrate-binding protein [Variovorax boronicumulans]
MATSLRGICSMATRGLLDELAAAYAQRTGVPVSFEAVGGIDAARRVADGESFDVAALASDAIDKLIAAGRLDAAGEVDIVRSEVGVAVHADAELPDIATEDAVRHAVQSAARIAYSTGPSGVALLALFARWGLAGEIRSRLVQAPPGVPVGALVARGEAALGFQQMSELIGLEGIRLLGPLPQPIQIVTTFSAAPGVGIPQRAAVRALLDFMASDDSAEAKRRHGMAPAAQR